MADILIDLESPPTTPAAGTMYIYGDTTSKRPQAKNDSGVVYTLGDIGTASTGGASPFASDTYLSGGNLFIPGSLVEASTTYYCMFDMVKTAAGVATFAINVRFGLTGTTSDSAKLTFTFGAGTAAIDTGIFEVWAHFRNVGVSAVMAGVCRCTHALAATGLVSTGASGVGILTATSSSFDSTAANNIIGISINGGASFSGTNVVVQSRMYNV